MFRSNSPSGKIGDGEGNPVGEFFSFADATWRAPPALINIDKSPKRTGIREYLARDELGLGGFDRRHEIFPMCRESEACSEFKLYFSGCR